MEKELSGKFILVTGAARRIGRILALTCANLGANVILHYGKSADQAQQLKNEIESMNCRAWTIQAD